VKVGYDIGPLTFSDQLIIVGGSSSFSDAGDSGSFIVDQTLPIRLIANHAVG
jgi:hypothetical protein